MKIISFFLVALQLFTLCQSSNAVAKQQLSHRLLQADDVNYFVEVGTGLCMDETQQQGAHRVMYGISKSDAEEWCALHACAGFAILPNRKRAVLYTSDGCENNCDQLSWLDAPELITRTSEHVQGQDVGVWENAICYRLTSTGQQALAKRRKLLLTAAAMALSTVAADFLMSTQALAFLTTVETGFGVGFTLTFGVEQVIIGATAIKEGGLSSDEIAVMERKAAYNALIGGAASALGEVSAGAYFLGRSAYQMGLGVQAFTRLRWQRWAWKKYRIRPSNFLSTVAGNAEVNAEGRFMYDASSREFQEAAATWYARNARTTYKFEMTFNPLIDAANNPGWYYELCLDHAANIGVRGARTAQFTNYLAFSVLPTLPTAFAFGLVVDTFYDWSMHTEVLEYIAQKDKKAANYEESQDDETRRELFEFRRNLKKGDIAEVGINRDHDRNLPQLSFSLEENFNEVNFLATITDEEYSRLSITQIPEGSNGNCEGIGAVESKWGDCRWMQSVAYNARCASERWNAFEKKKDPSMEKLICNGDWIQGDASDVSHYDSDFTTCPQFKSIESKHSWLFPITALHREIRFEFCPDNESYCQNGPDVKFVIESLNGTVQVECGSDQYDYNHMLYAHCDISSGKFVTITIPESLKFSLVNSLTQEELKNSAFPDSAKAISFDEVFFRISVQPTSSENTQYHIRQVCVEDEFYTGFYNAIMSHTYGDCIDPTFPNSDEANQWICRPDVVEHECQFCTKFGAGFEDDEFRQDLVAECKSKGYVIDVCFEAEKQPKLGKTMCRCSSPNEGRSGKNGYTCDDNTDGWCAETEICYNNYGEFVKGDWSSACATSSCLLSNEKVPSSDTWSACWWHKGMSTCRIGLNEYCCCNEGYTLAYNSRNEPYCRRCGENE